MDSPADQLTKRRTSGTPVSVLLKISSFEIKKTIDNELIACGENSRRVESVIAYDIVNQFRLLGRSQNEWGTYGLNHKTYIL